MGPFSVCVFGMGGGVGVGVGVGCVVENRFDHVAIRVHNYLNNNHFADDIDGRGWGWF